MAHGDSSQPLQIPFPLLKRFTPSDPQTTFLQDWAELGRGLQIQAVSLLLGHGQHPQHTLKVSASSCGCVRGLLDTKIPMSGLTCSKTCARTVASMPSKVSMVLGSLF